MCTFPAVFLSFKGQGLAVGQGHTREVTPGAEAGAVAGRGRKYHEINNYPNYRLEARKRNLCN